ncbi:MAG: hypothetical protein WCK82_11175 [Bacteroidota bacterium]
MGDIAPDKRPKRVARKDNTDIAMYAEGGKVSRVNEAGVYTKPGMRKAIFEKIKGQATQGKQFVKQPPKVAAKTARYR